MSLYLVFILSALFVTSSGNFFSAFAPLSTLRSFSPFSNFPSFGSSFPFGQPYGSSYSSDDSFNSPYSIASSPFPNTFSTSLNPQTSSPFRSGFSSGTFTFPPFPSFPPMLPFPSFNSFTNDLKGNGFKVTSTSSEGKDGSSGRVTIQVEKIGDEKKPGEQRRVVQTFRTAGPLVPSNQMLGKVQNKTDRRVVNKPPSNQKVPQSNRAVNQQRKPLFTRPMKPAAPTKISLLNDLSFNSTTSQQQPAVSSSNKQIHQEQNNNQLIKINGATVSSSKTSSSLSIPSTSQNIVNENRSSFSSGNSKVTSNKNSQSSGVTIKRVDSSGRVTTGFIQP